MALIIPVLKLYISDIVSKRWFLKIFIKNALLKIRNLKFHTIRVRTPEDLLNLSADEMSVFWVCNVDRRVQNDPWCKQQLTWLPLVKVGCCERKHRCDGAKQIFSSIDTNHITLNPRKSQWRRDQKLKITTIYNG